MCNSIYVHTHTNTHTHTHTKKCRKQGVGPVAFNPDNLENAHTQTHTHTSIIDPPVGGLMRVTKMARMTGPDCAVMCNLTNTHTHAPTHTEREKGANGDGDGDPGTNKGWERGPERGRKRQQ